MTLAEPQELPPHEESQIERGVHVYRQYTGIEQVAQIVVYLSGVWYFTKNDPVLGVLSGQQIRRGLVGRIGGHPSLAETLVESINTRSNLLSSWKTLPYEVAEWGVWLRDGYAGGAFNLAMLTRWAKQIYGLDTTSPLGILGEYFLTGGFWVKGGFIFGSRINPPDWVWNVTAQRKETAYGYGESIQPLPYIRIRHERDLQMLSPQTDLQA